MPPGASNQSVDDLDVPDLVGLARWSTPAVYNAWEALTRRERNEGAFNRDATTDFVPNAGPMVGYAVTVEIEPSNPRWPRNRPAAWEEYRAYLASVPGPKIAVVKDLDGPNTMGAFFGEVNTTVHQALGCVGAITDGAIRDLAEVRSLGFKHLARRLCVGHAYVCPVRWNVNVTVFGCEIRPGDLVHADVHGFLAIPPEDQSDLLEATAFLDGAERATLLEAAQSSQGPGSEIPMRLAEAKERYGAMVRARFGSADEP